jgi:hypothetical protein
MNFNDFERTCCVGFLFDWGIFFVILTTYAAWKGANLIFNLLII